MMELVRVLVECAGVVVALAGAFLLFGPVALLVGGGLLVLWLEVTDGSSEDG